MPAQCFLPDMVRPALALAPSSSVNGMPAFAGDSLGLGDPSSPPSDDDTSARRHHRGDSWEGEPVATFGCRLRDLPGLLPSFSREPFGHPSFDLIVRDADHFIAAAVPIGLVSRSYALVQHREAVIAIARALWARRISPDDLPVEVTISEFGRRLTCSVRLPEEFDFVEPDATRMALTIECFNSVDGSSAFRVLTGWFRLVCTNGMIVGNSKLDFRRRHTPSLRLWDVESALERGLLAAELERNRFARWQAVEAKPSQVAAWAESVVAEKWGALAAARLLHIARTGRDGHFATNRWRGRLRDRPMLSGDAVPGSVPPADTVYKVAQVLAWLAGQTREVGARIQRRAQVTGMVRRLARL